MLVTKEYIDGLLQRDSEMVSLLNASEHCYKDRVLFVD
jgi:hypothetical protein